MTAPHPESESPVGHGSPSDPEPTERTRTAGRAVATGARATARGVRGVARATGRAGRYTLGQARRAANAEGAEASGLSRLLEMHALNAAGDAAVAISLAGTLFFTVPTGEARGQVALFLGLTMLPFAVVAPLLGPVLDRFAHGRRWAIGSTLAFRCFCTWVMAGAVVTGSTWLFPAALGCLVASKAYGVTKAAAVPRLVPENLTLVKANARTSLAGVVGATVSAPLAGLAAYLGPEWCLRYAFLVFALGTIAAIRLPAQVDSSVGEETLALTGDAAGRTRSGRPRVRIPRSMAFALRANCGPRWLSGFLTMFMAFLLREQPVNGWRPELLLGVVIGAAGLGNTLGITLGSVLKRVNPGVTVVLALVADAAMTAVAGLFYSVVTLAALGLTAGLAQAMAKLSLDATIQRDVPDRVQTSAFARSDTTLQLAWVLGGFIGIAMPLHARLGLFTACVVLAAWALLVVAGRAAPRRATGSAS